MPIRERLPDEQFDTATQADLKFSPKNDRSLTDGEQDSNISLTKSELAQRPDLLFRALVPALIGNNMRGVEILLPIYQSLPEQKQDPVLLNWAKAMVAHKQGKLSESVDLYRRLIAANPEILPARFQLATVLFANQENEAAADQFNKLRSEELAPQIRETVETYIEALKHRDSWIFNGGVTYLNESNINNAPKAGTRVGNWTPSSRPEKAEGFSYFFSAEKKWSLERGMFALFGLTTDGKHYWDNRKYNELSARLKAGLGYRNAQSEISLAPFIERFWYANGENDNASTQGTLHRYSKTGGITLEAEHWLNNQWRLSGMFEYGEQRHTERKPLNGNLYSFSTSLLYMPNSNQYWFVGADYYRKNAERKANAFDRKGVRLGWGQEWPKGISTRLQLSYAKRDYQAPLVGQNALFAPSFYKITQKNDEYGIFLTLWHRQFHIFGITPKITWSYQKTDSNNPFSSYDKRRSAVAPK